MRNIFKIIVLFGLAVMGGTLISASFINKSVAIESVSNEFADDIINSSVFIRGITLDTKQIALSGSGSVIKVKDNDTLYILSAAHLLKSGFEYIGSMNFVKNGFVFDDITFRLVETEYVDKDNDLVLFVAKLDRKLPIVVSNKSLKTLHSNEIFRRKVIISSYPHAIGPFYTEGMAVGGAINEEEDVVIINILSVTHGSSGGVVYDLETHKIVGMVSRVFDFVGPIIIISGEKIENFLSTCKVLE